MAIERLSPLEPARLREFGASVSWLMRRNALCENFGVRHDGPQPDGGAKGVSDARYRLDLASGRAKCRGCGARIRDNHAWRNAKLLHPRFAEGERPLLVQTDALAANVFATLPMPAVNMARVPQRSPSRHPGGKTWLIPIRRRRVIQRGRCCGRV